MNPSAAGLPFLEQSSYEPVLTKYLMVFVAASEFLKCFGLTDFEKVTLN